MTKFILWCSVILTLVIPQYVGAAEINPTKDALDLYYEVTQSFVDQAKKAGMLLLLGLLGMQITINGVKKLIRPSEMEGLVSAILWPLISVSFFAALIQLSDTLLPRLIDSFTWLGQKAGGGMKLSPGEFIFYGIDVAMEMQEKFNVLAGDGFIDAVMNIFPAMFLLFIQIVVVLSFAILGMQMALALINAYFWFCVTPILLGFGGVSYTKDMALSSLKGGIAVGVKLMVIYLIAAVALKMAPLWGTLIGTISLDNFKPFWVVGTSVALLAYLAMQVPKLAADLLNGTASLTAGDAATNTMMGMAALATAGAGAMAAGGAIKHAGGAALETLGGLAQAGMSGMNSAHDLGKAGFDAVGHATKEVASHSGGVVGGSLRNMLDTSSSNLRAGVESSFGGRVAQSIESSRGGSISAAPEVGRNAGNINGSDMGDAGNTKNSQGGGAPEPSNSGGVVNNSSDAGLGDASQASLSSGEGGSSPISNDKFDKLGQQLEQLTSTMADGRQASTADKIRNLAGYVPSDQAAVGVSSNLGHGGGEE